MISNQAYTEAFRDGMVAACNGVAREQATVIARSYPDKQSDGYLAGYHAELRKLRKLRAAEEEREFARRDPRQSSLL